MGRELSFAGVWTFSSIEPFFSVFKPIFSPSKKRFRLSQILPNESGNIGFGQDRINGETFATRSEVLAQSGMVATSHPLATQIGIDILKSGGNAVNAAIFSIDRRHPKIGTRDAPNL